MVPLYHSLDLHIILSRANDFGWISLFLCVRQHSIVIIWMVDCNHTQITADVSTVPLAVRKKKRSPEFSWSTDSPNSTCIVRVQCTNFCVIGVKSNASIEKISHFQMVFCFQLAFHIFLFNITASYFMHIIPFLPQYISRLLAVLSHGCDR